MAVSERWRGAGKGMGTERHALTVDGGWWKLERGAIVTCRSARLPAQMERLSMLCTRQTLLPPTLVTVATYMHTVGRTHTLCNCYTSPSAPTPPPFRNP